jgi:NAD(P)-dependent dehydrogenase (short-subunit alcohol dehydrogenase family)
MKNVIIAGGNGFLGRQFAEFLVSKKNFNVHIIDKSLIKNKNRNLYQYKCDILDEKKISKKINSIFKKFLSIDVLINCVARDYIPNKKNNKLFENLSIKDLKSDFEIGITTSVIMAKHVSKFMIKQNKGNILNIGSDLSFISPNQNIYSNFVKPISYSIVKHGIIGLTKYLATYLIKYNIRCNALCPGGMYNNQDKNFLTKLNKLIPMKRMAKKNELNEAMYFLISEKSSYVNGHSLMVDGGRTIW